MRQELPEWLSKLEKALPGSDGFAVGNKAGERHSVITSHECSNNPLNPLPPDINPPNTAIIFQAEYLGYGGGVIIGGEVMTLTYFDGKARVTAITAEHG